ncbi:BQ5605_C014g07468 [Microbotryum silenes-dioicae]|uniref:BQ5605_C014g07468 protein n=1 Tax=Microbotryum silenes-dioicae TaxID=796604 RepID=A0A2X0LU14_9BASI|nr:BQ5605_C014g07468 [Microbotryum silenes-dioicae]
MASSTSATARRQSTASTSAVAGAAGASTASNLNNGAIPFSSTTITGTASASIHAPALGGSTFGPAAGAALAGQEFEQIAAKLSDPGLDSKHKINIATELRDSVDMYQRDMDVARFFDTLLPCFIDILSHGKPSFAGASTENRLRNLLIQILHRLPHVEPLRSHAPPLMILLLKLLRIENEDNAVLCMKVIIDLHRTYSRGPHPLASGAIPGQDSMPDPTAVKIEASVDEFLGIVADLFKGMGAVVDETFSSETAGSKEASSPAAAAPPTIEGPEGGGAGAVIHAPAMKSFKLLQDCPAAIVFIFQTYRSYVDKAITIFVPLVFDFLQLQAAPQARKHASMEPGKSWVGTCPEISKAKRGAFQDMVLAQTKTMSFLAYMLRVSQSALSSYLNILPDIAVRLMKDCPSEAVAMKRDLVVATRHILQSELRSAFLGQIDTLLDDHVLVGNSVTGYESLRPLAYSMLADLIHHVRSELSLSQLSRIVHTYSANIHDPTLAAAIQTMCSKLLLNLIEPIATKEPSEAIKILQRMLIAFVSKIEALAEVRDEWSKWSKPREPLPHLLARIEKLRDERKESIEASAVSKAAAPTALKGKGKSKGKSKGKEKEAAQIADATDAMNYDDDAAAARAKLEGGDDKEKDDDGAGEDVQIPELDDVDIERSKPMKKAMVMTDPGPDPIKDARFLFRNLLFGFKTITSALIKLEGKGPDAEMMCRFFRASVKCMVLFDSSRDQGREQKEVMEVFSSTLIQIELVILQEVIEHCIGFFFTELIRNHELLVIPQTLLSNEMVSQHFVAILFRFLASRLPDLGKAGKEYKDYMSVTLRLYKMSFMAVTIFPEKNEPVLLPHLSNLIMNSLKLASQAAEPHAYYLLLRALFRSIGGGRFEILYNEVLPLLQGLLEQLNALLKAADKSKKDLFAELILTVPVRLSVLLPYLSFLMRPLVHALRASSELVSQGLRTLELCVDNLTQEFLNPLMAPVIDEVMVGLWELLRPLPFNHQHAHTTMRILGKIGGRNRKGFGPPKLEWKPVGPEALLNVKFEGKDASLHIAPIVNVAVRMLGRGDPYYRRAAYSFLKYAVAIFLRNGLPAGQPEETFGQILKGLFDATRVEEFAVEANDYVFNLARHIFSLELGKELPENPAYAKQVLPLCSALLDGIIENICGVENADLPKAAEQTQLIVEDLIATRDPATTTAASAAAATASANPTTGPPPRLDPATALLHQLGSRLSSLCYDPSWQRKTGAAMGLSILTDKVGLETRWILDHEIEFTRALLFSLKDMPGEAPINHELVSDTLLHIVRVCSGPGARENTPASNNQLNYLVGLLLLELCSQISSVRETVKKALKILSELTSTPLTELLMPVRDRLITPIFTKPLRALGFMMQIGHIDAVTFCITLDPPLIDFDEQLSRLLHEALGIADAEDAALLGGKMTTKTTAPLTQLRVVCVELLSAALSNSEFNKPQHQPTRLKALSVYFKLLYAKAPEVVDAACESLRQVMAQQGKLPKDLLQSGLKPVLVNLADHKKLSVASLQVGLAKGLARLLQLLTNYFKVEIGHKLIDHFKALATPADLQRLSTKQSSDDGVLEIMAAIINIFHLLPHPAANIFIEALVTLVADAERQLKKLKTSVFTVPLTKYLRLYPGEAVQFFFTRLADARFVTTFRAVIASELSEPIRDQITLGVNQLFISSFESEGDVGYHAALVMRELIEIDRTWIVKCSGVLGQLITRWVSDIRRQRLAAEGDAHFQQLREDAVVLDIFIAYLEQAEHIDLLFHVVDAFTFWNSANLTVLTRFLNQHVALSHDVKFKRTILDRFIDIFENPAVAKAHKTAALRMLTNPILLVSSSRGAGENDLIDGDFINKVHAKVWQPLLATVPDLATFEDEALRVELCHMSTLLIKSYSHLVLDNKKDVIKFGWVTIKLEDITVKQAAYVLIASFLERYESPGKIVVQIYVALLKAHQPEARALVREALDILAPSLPKRMGPGVGAGPASVAADSTYWAKWTRKILVEDSGSMALLVNIYQLIVRHPDLFYPTRELFVPHMVASLAKLTLSSTTTSDTRVLTLDVIELILKWEKKRIEAAKLEEMTKMEVDADLTDVVAGSPKRTGKDRAGSTAPSTTSTSDRTGGYAVPAVLRDQVINNLLRFIANSPEAFLRNNYVARALVLLKELVSPNVWNDLHVKLAFFQRTFAGVQTEVPEPMLVTLCNSAEVLNVVSLHKSPDWYISNIATLQLIFDKGYSIVAVPSPSKSVPGQPLGAPSMVINEMRLQTALRPVLERTFDALPRGVGGEGTEATPEVVAFFEWARNMINKHLGTITQMPPTMLVLQAWAKASPECVDEFISLIARACAKYTKDHVVSTSTAPLPGDPTLRLLVSSLELLRQRVSHLGEHRRWLLSSIVQLVEKSNNVELCRFLLQMTRKWVTDHDEPFPTMREKAGILHKMMAYEARGNEPLHRDYLSLILDIYSNPALARSDLTMKLEPAFLMGCRARDPVMRSKFLATFDGSLATSLFSRLHYILGVQSWEPLGDTYWIHQALDLLLGSVDPDEPLFVSSSPKSVLNAMPDATMDTDDSSPPSFVEVLSCYTSGMLLGAARKILYADPQATHALWISTFKTSWACLNRREHLDLTRLIVSLITKEYHLKSIDRRPNAIQTLLAGVLACSPAPTLPPHVVRYLAKTFNVWHTGLELLQETLENPREEDSVREMTLDALAETYSELSEDDLLYGLWRRRASYNETNAAISWEQIGQWGQAQVLYESAQITARSGVQPFTESEMALWEDHWIVTAQKLQQWDVLMDLAKNEGNKELLLECSWRLTDWNVERDFIEQTLSSMSPITTPRRRVFEAYLALLRAYPKDVNNDGSAKKAFAKLCDEGIQLSLRKWYYLPEAVSQAHVPLLTIFQQFVELQEANAIFASLHATDAANLDQRSNELKTILGTWRDRLPNLWDDINVWSDLVAWRQHVFQAINATYLPLVPQAAPGQPQNASSFAYRGFHETAWIINRFAHVARKHHLNEVCVTSLTKIYTLPNIEIQEAFLKLREQAKCHYASVSELASGLEVINNTNLMYFNASQKAEFFTLKGMFLAKLHLHEEANQTFNLAVSMEMAFPKAWAEWGEYHDRMFKENPTDLGIASNAVSCYLQAAGLYKSAKVRKLLVRILWLLSLDDAQGTISKAFDSYKGEVPTWYWITFIPQLLLSLSQREARYSRVILLKIAKVFPQSLFFQLRTVREDLSMPKRQHMAAHIQAVQAQRMNEARAAGLDAEATAVLRNEPIPAPTPLPNGPRHPWEYVDEIMSILKTAFPLLALSMEMIVDQISTRFKPTPDEDIFRLISALLADGLQQFLARAGMPNDDGKLAAPTISNVTRFAENLHPPTIKESFVQDFLTSEPTLAQYVQRLQRWRDRYEGMLDKKAKKANLEAVSHWLVEFQYQKFDEIEVPGQYLMHEDNNGNFVRISHFANKFDVTRSHGIYFRRLTILGHDGSTHRFAIQVPSARTSRREERIMQLFRMLNCPLATRKESRKRNLAFNIPIVVPLAPNVRLVENDASITSLQDIFEQHCDLAGIKKEDPILAHTERVRALHHHDPPLSRTELWNARQEIAEEIALKMVPDDILKKYMIRSMASSSELWHIRREMTLQMAAFIFMTYVMSMGVRLPSRVHISRSSGKLLTSDMLPSIIPTKPEFFNNEAVPFRFTPNFQRFITPIGTEGLLTSSMMAIARCLTESEVSQEFDFEHRLSIFVREEILVWAQMAKSDPRGQLRELVLRNVDVVVQRAKVMSCKMEREKVRLCSVSPPSASVPVNQSILELLLSATSVQNLSKMEPTFAPWL